MFESSFGQLPCRFTLEVDDDEVFSGIENLAEVIVAMDPNPHR